MIFSSLNKKQKDFACSPRHLGFNHLSSTGSGGCVQHCVCLLVSVVVCAEAFYNKCSTQYICMQHYDPHSSISVSFPPKPKVFHLSLPNKAPIHCPANQSLHSCSQLSMTQFIWPGPCPSQWPSSFFYLFGRATESQITIQCHMQCIGAYKRLLPVATSLRSLSHFTCRPGQIPPCGASLSYIFL